MDSHLLSTDRSLTQTVAARLMISTNASVIANRHERKKDPNPNSLLNAHALLLPQTIRDENEFKDKPNKQKRERTNTEKQDDERRWFKP